MPPEDIRSLLERFQGGPAVEESVIMAGLEPAMSADLQARLDLINENVVRPDEQEYFGKILQAAIQVDPSIEDATNERIELAEARQNETEAYLEGLTEFPEAQEVEQQISLGSYSGTFKPPYKYRWLWKGFVGGGINRNSADLNTGRLSCYSSSGGYHGKGNAACVSGVGLFFQPSISRGTLTVSSNPSYSVEGHTYSVLCYGTSRSWLGIRVFKYEAETDRYRGVVSDRGQAICYRHTWWSGTTCRQGSSAISFLHSFPVDSAHYYGIFVWCLAGGGGGGRGPLWYGGGSASIKSTVPYIRLSLS